MAEGSCHLRARQMFAGQADRLANELASSFENIVKALTNILGRDAGELLVAHRQSDRQLAVGIHCRVP